MHPTDSVATELNVFPSGRREYRLEGGKKKCNNVFEKVTPIGLFEFRKITWNAEGRGEAIEEARNIYICVFQIGGCL